MLLPSIKPCMKHIAELIKSFATPIWIVCHMSILWNLAAPCGPFRCRSCWVKGLSDSHGSGRCSTYDCAILVSAFCLKFSWNKCKTTNTVWTLWNYIPSSDSGLTLKPSETKNVKTFPSFKLQIFPLIPILSCQTEMTDPSHTCGLLGLCSIPGGSAVRSRQPGCFNLRSHASI